MPIILLQFYVQVLACCHLHLYGNKLLLDFTEVVLVGSFHRKTFEKVGSLPPTQGQKTARLSKDDEIVPQQEENSYRKEETRNPAQCSINH